MIIYVLTNECFDYNLVISDRHWIPYHVEIKMANCLTWLIVDTVQPKFNALRKWPLSCGLTSIGIKLDITARLVVGPSTMES